MNGIRRKKTFHIWVVVISVVFIGAILGNIYKVSPQPLVSRLAGYLRALIYFSLIIAWSFSVYHRILQKRVLLHLLFISALMIYWQLARTMRYLFVIDCLDLLNFLWYTYYIPMILIPLSGLFVALYLGKADEYRPSKWLSLLFLPAIFLIGLVLTNNLHHKVFIFAEGDTWDRLNYQYAIGYKIIFAWEFILAIATLIVLIVKCRAPRGKKILWLPFVPLAVYTIYAILYAIRVPIVHALAGDMTIVLCLLTMAIFESCIQVGLIRSNTKYEELFYASGLATQIVDKDFRLRYKANMTPYIPEDIMRKAVFAPIELYENTRLRSAAISGGYALWLEDIREINRILLDLKETGEHLAKNNDLLAAELELKEHKAAVEEKTRIYNRVTKEVSEQLEKLDSILSSCSSMPLKQQLIWLCVIGTYIKRRTNLVILCEDSKTLLAKELEYCLLESSEAISSCGINCSLNKNTTGYLQAFDALLLYDFFEEIVEAVLPTLAALFITIHIKDGSTKMNLQIAGNNDAAAEYAYKNLARLESRSGHINKIVEDGIVYISLHLPKGGEGK